jgi:short-subunit dehydrogenase
MSYALITGASSGIGFELARLFAKDSHNLVLVARRGERLKQLSRDLEDHYKIKTLVIAKDLIQSQAAQEIYDMLKQNDITIDYLINNAGFIVYGHFADTNWSEENKMIQLHIATITHLIKLFLPEMLRRNNGKILNVGSTGSFVPGPFNAVYCATKNYILSLSEAIAAELAGTGVTVTALCPGGTKTEFAEKANVKNSSGNFFQYMEAEQVAKIGYEALMKGKRVVVPGTLNKLQIFSTRFIPRILVSKLIKILMSKYKKSGLATHSN